MKRNLREIGRVRITLRNWLEGGVEGPATQHEVVVEIDIAGLAEHLGYRAVKGKNGFASFVDGTVVVRKI
jgi:hypothetical protein